VKGLPADAPPLVISGGVYSADRDRRMVIVNGKVVKEGADLGSGLLLEQITPSGVVVGFRGTHYRLMY
jgi:general secretion pathway protein B